LAVSLAKTGLHNGVFDLKSVTECMHRMCKHNV